MNSNTDLHVNDRQRAEKLVLDRLESLQQAGVTQLPKARVGKVRRSIDAETNPTPADTQPTPSPSFVPKSATLPDDAPIDAERADSANVLGWQPLGSNALFDTGGLPMAAISHAPTMEILQQEVAACTRCVELANTRTQTVFGVGNCQAQLCFIGEAPGADEDRLGEPFVGRAGQLLTRIIEACRMQRSDVYILNMLKCRPPGNRTPLPDELANCRGFLERQLALLRPQFICCLGAVAAQNLLGTTVSIGKLRGKVHLCRGAKVVCTYHPAYLLRNPAAKKDAWDDMKMLMREMGVEL